MPKHFLKCDLVKTTPFDKEPKLMQGSFFNVYFDNFDKYHEKLSDDL